jgi:hypothetical protein
MKYTAVLFCLVGFLSTATGQIRLGIKGGFTTTNLEVSQLSVPSQNGGTMLNLDVDDARFGIQGGLLLQIPLGKKWLLQPEVLFNSNRVDFEVEDFTGGAAIESIKSEKYQYLDLPLLLHYRLGPLRLSGGPVGHLYINSSSDLTDFDSYDQRFDELTYGYLLGGGLDIWNLMIDVRYEGNFTKFGNHITFNGETYAFDEEPARLILSLSLLFGK